MRSSPTAMYRDGLATAPRVAPRRRGGEPTCWARRLGLVDKPIRSQQKLLHFVLSVPSWHLFAAGARASIRYALSRALSADPLLPEMIFGECDEAHTHCAEMGASRGH